MVVAYSLRALDLRWVVGVVGVDGKGEHESTTLVHAYGRDVRQSGNGVRDERLADLHQE